MNNALLVAIITGCFGLISTVISVYLTHKLNKMHKQYNSRMDEFLALTKKAGHAEGVQEQKDKDGS